jgi:putative ABC transport system permease protein
MAGAASGLRKRQHGVVRAADGRDPEMVLPAIRQALADVSRQLVVTATTTMEAALEDVVSAERFRAMLSTAFAASALLLAVIGLYAIAARRVAERRRELGIRVALDAGPHDLRMLLLRDGMLTAGVSLAMGLPAAFAMAQVTRACLPGVSPTEPHVFLLASMVLAAAAMTATFPPAQRASRVDAMAALRE